MRDDDISRVNHANQNKGVHVLREEGINGKAANFFLDEGYHERMEEFQRQLDKIKRMVRPGCPVELLNAALSLMVSLVDVLDLLSTKSNLRSSL